MGEILADLGVEDGVESVGFRLISCENDSTGVLIAGDSTISPHSSSSSSATVGIACAGFDDWEVAPILVSRAPSRVHGSS